MFSIMAKVGQGNVVLAEKVRFFFRARALAEQEAYRTCTDVEVLNTKTGRVAYTAHTS